MMESYDEYDRRGPAHKILCKIRLRATRSTTHGHPHTAPADKCRMESYEEYDPRTPTDKYDYCTLSFSGVQPFVISLRMES